MSGVSIEYRTYWGGTRKQPLAGFAVGSKPWVTVREDHEKPLLVVCPCGANNWTENGRWMNEYECDCCGEFVLTEPKQEKYNDQ